MHSTIDTAQALNHLPTWKTSDGREWFSVYDLADAFRVHPSTVTRWYRTGRLERSPRSADHRFRKTAPRVSVTSAFDLLNLVAS